MPALAFVRLPRPTGTLFLSDGTAVKFKLLTQAEARVIQARSHSAAEWVFWTFWAAVVRPVRVARHLAMMPDGAAEMTKLGSSILIRSLRSLASEIACRN